MHSVGDGGNIWGSTYDKVGMCFDISTGINFKLLMLQEINSDIVQAKPSSELEI
jgi:hypothetical protein